MTSNIRGSSICSPKSLYKKTSQEILGELKAAFKTGASKVPRPRPVLPSLLRPICQACVDSQLSPTPPSPPRGREKKNVTKMNFSSCNDHSPKWIINDCYIFFPYLRVWVFLFLRTSFFTAQHVGPMLHMNWRIYVKVKLATIVEGNPKAPFSIATTPMCRGGRYSFPGLLYFTLDPYLIMLSAKQGSIKYHFLSLWYDSTWDWTQVSRAIGEHSNP